MYKARGGGDGEEGRGLRVSRRFEGGWETVAK